MEAPREFLDGRRSAFERLGFVHCGRIFSESEVSGIRRGLARFREVSEEARNPGGWTYDNNVERRDPFFAALARDARLVRLGEELLGSEVDLFTMHFRNSPPGSGHETFPHQDALGPSLHPCEAVTFWIALGDYGEENGCLRYVAESHRDLYQPELWGTLPNPAYPLHREQVMPVRTGEVLAHHWFTVHRTAPNATPHERWALMVSFTARHAKRIPEEAWMAIYGRSGRGAPRRDS